MFLCVTETKAAEPDSLQTKALEADVNRKTAAIERRYQEMWALDQVVYRAGYGYFFVEWHCIMDMACLKAVQAVQGDGSMKQPCALCMCTQDELHSGNMTGYVSH